MFKFLYIRTWSQLASIVYFLFCIVALIYSVKLDMALLAAVQGFCVGSWIFEKFTDAHKSIYRESKKLDSELMLQQDELIHLQQKCIIDLQKQIKKGHE